MCSHSFILACLASLVLSYAVQQPVADDKFVRRCANESHPLFWPYSNATSTQSPYSPGNPGSGAPGLITGGLSTGAPFPWPCGGYGGGPCYSTGTGSPAAGSTAPFNTSGIRPITNISTDATSHTISVGPDMNATATFPANQSAVSTTSDTPTVSGASVSVNVTANSVRFTALSQSPQASTTQANATTAGGSSSYAATSTLTSNATAIVFPNNSRTVGPAQPWTSVCRNSIGSICSPINATYFPTGSGTGGWSPPWANASSYSPQSASSRPGTASGNITELVATLTIGLTPSPEVVTLTATVDVGGVQTSSTGSANLNATSYTTGATTTTTYPPGAGLITMTIVVASNATTILQTQTFSTSASSTGAGTASNQPSETNSVSSTSGNGTSAATNLTVPMTVSGTTISSSPSVPLSTAGPQNSTLTSMNGTLTAPATTSTPYWGNSTSSTPCTWEASNGGPIWSDWNLTTSSLFRGANGSFSAQPTSESVTAGTSTTLSTNSTTTPGPSVAASALASTLNVNSTSTSASNNSLIQVAPTSNPANASNTTTTQLTSATLLSNQVGPTGLSPNASTLCLANATVAFCPSTAAPWLSTAVTAGTAGASAGTTLTTSFLSGVNGSLASTGPSVASLRLSQARSARKARGS